MLPDTRCHLPWPSGLLESGCTDFLRVGALRRISRRLLGQVRDGGLVAEQLLTPTCSACSV